MITKIHRIRVQYEESKKDMKSMKKEIILAVLAASLLIIGCSQSTTEEVTRDEGTLLILQAYGNAPMDGGSPAGVSHSFVELYNSKKREINLNGYGLYWANGTDLNTVNIEEDGYPVKDGNWTRISLDGHTIPAGGSLLVLGAKHPNTADTRFVIEDDYGDINNPTLILNRRGFKATLLQSTVDLNNPDIQNPFDIDGGGTKVEGYIDMVGASNTWAGFQGVGGRDFIFGYETEPARNSASEAVRRQDIRDTNDNYADFIAARYAGDLNGMTDEELEVRRPRSTSAGAWDPFAPPAPPPETNTLMILQANTFGNDNGVSNGVGGGFPRSLVELYNNTNAAINLTTGNYYLHIGNLTAWTGVIELQGMIPAKSSFLIVSNTMPETTGGSGNYNATPRALLPPADQFADFVLNNGFKVALLRSQGDLLSVPNPFTEPSLNDYYVDMLGAGGAALNAFETAGAVQSRPQGPRRKTLNDTDNNSIDFIQIDFRGLAAGNGIPDNELYRFWPRNATQPWNPVTGLPQLHPNIPNQ